MPSWARYESMSLPREKSRVDMQRGNKEVLKTEREQWTEAGLNVYVILALNSLLVLLCAGPGCVLLPIPAYIPTITSSLLLTLSRFLFPVTGRTLRGQRYFWM